MGVLRRVVAGDGLLSRCTLMSLTLIIMPSLASVFTQTTKLRLGYFAGSGVLVGGEQDGGAHRNRI